MRLAQLVRHAARRLMRAPAFSSAAVLTLMLGVGATTAVFSVVNGVLLRPLPFPHSDRLVDLSHTLAVSGATHVDQSDATFLYYRKANHVFQDVAAYRSVGVNLGDPTKGSSAARSDSHPVRDLRSVTATTSARCIIRRRTFRRRAATPRIGTTSSIP